MGFIGDSSVSKSNQESNQQSTNTNIDTTNETTNTNVTDNSMEMSSNVNSNTQIDSSMVTTNINTVDQSSIMNIQSSTDTYNVDNSQVINTKIQNATSKLIQSCGMSIEQANTAVNIVKAQSVNPNIDASNTFINTGNNASITDLIQTKLESTIDFNGNDIDRSCVYDALDNLQSELAALNDNSKSFAGGEGGDVGAEAGGSTTLKVNNISKKVDRLDATSMVGHAKDSVSCPICAEIIPSSSTVCPICAEPLAIALSAAPVEASHSGQNTVPAVHRTGENMAEEVLEELKKINKNLSLIAKHLLFD